MSIIPDQVQTVLIELYEGTVRWQTRRSIRVDLTQDEYISLWSKHRIAKLAELIAKGESYLVSYLTNPAFKPVCGWTTREAREGRILNAGNAQIMTAEAQRRLFQFKRGDIHSPDARAKMRKPKSDAHKAKMSEAAKRRHARARGEIQ